eukprot:6148644-Prymnesium_polylepis.1
MSPLMFPLKRESAIDCEPDVGASPAPKAERGGGTSRGTGCELPKAGDPDAPPLAASGARRVAANEAARNHSPPMLPVAVPAVPLPAPGALGGVDD